MQFRQQRRERLTVAPLIDVEVSPNVGVAAHPHPRPLVAVAPAGLVAVLGRGHNRRLRDFLYGRPDAHRLALRHAWRRPKSSVVTPSGVRYAQASRRGTAWGGECVRALA